MEKSTQIAELKAEIDRLSKKVADLEKQPELTAKEKWEEDYEAELDKMTHKANWYIHFYNENHEQTWDEQTRLMTEMQTFAKLRNGDWVADWENDEQLKVGIVLSRHKAERSTRWTQNEFVYGISFDHDKPEIAQEALEIFGERIEQFYGK